MDFGERLRDILLIMTHIQSDSFEELHELFMNLLIQDESLKKLYLPIVNEIHNRRNKRADSVNKLLSTFLDTEKCKKNDN